MNYLYKLISVERVAKAGAKLRPRRDIQTSPRVRAQEKIREIGVKKLPEESW